MRDGHVSKKIKRILRDVAAQTFASGCVICMLCFDICVVDGRGRAAGHKHTEILPFRDFGEA